VHVAIASDHAGFALKEDLKGYLDELRVTYDDLGPASDAPVDYPDFAALVANAVQDGRAERGILICGTGIGMSIVANKFPGIRAALVTDQLTARLSRQHNDANVLALGGRTTPVDLACAIVRTFLTTAFESGRHGRRVEKISHLDIRPDHTQTTTS
jgi:RpiB/LacA/LacB family sugar-phosphate isomerase